MYVKVVVVAALNYIGEGLRRGLLRDYEPSDGPSFQALEFTHLVSG